MSVSPLMRSTTVDGSNLSRLGARTPGLTNQIVDLIYRFGKEGRDMDRGEFTATPLPPTGLSKGGPCPIE